jgi:hypothetical protein
MTPAETAAAIAAMQREAEARRPLVEARRAKEPAAAEARLIEAFRSHLSESESYPQMTIEERS